MHDDAAYMQPYLQEAIDQRLASYMFPASSFSSYHGSREFLWLVVFLGLFEV
jgi:hypothetical protein